ncbi:MAG: family 20 glycosylhydrolase, partial [Planctomycetota bacterium]
MKAVSTIGFFILLIFLIIPTSLIEGKTSEAISVIPQPVKAELKEGTFVLTPETLIVVTEGSGGIGEYLAELLAAATAFKLEVKKISQAKGEANCIVLQIAPEDGNPSSEGYRLSVDKDGVVISARAQAGIFYGIQSLRQLLPVEIERGSKVKEITLWQIPCVEIKDEPRFQWRGLMIDCSRTFWSKAFILRTIRLMSLYKLNRLHLHLTDDQGWRLEIKKHPALTEIGSKFAEKYNEPTERQGYYSQSDMREIIAYGKRHNVTIVPEIEMPGHSIATLTVYPELSCGGGPFEIFPFFKGPGINKDILCAGNEKTFEFLEEVLAEVVDLFDCEYVHIGGDEAPKDRWRECSKCQRRMREEGLIDEDELQSYFIKRIEEFLNSKGKRLIGWDEILEGGLAPNAAVMSWRGTRGGITAARAGHDVVMSPTSHCYFDYDYDKISTMKAYGYEPVPAEVAGEQVKHILGAQANFWSHIDRTEAGMDRQIFPRLLALSEVTWSPKEQRQKKAFAKKVRMHCWRLKELGVRYFADPSVVQPGSQGICEAADPTAKHYVEAVRSFAETVLKHGRDVYGKEKTPLFVDGLNAETLAPVKWECRGQTWVLSNFASQQPFVRLLDGLTGITGEEKYRRAAEEATRYALAHLQSPSGLLYWGGHTAWDLEGDQSVSQYPSGNVHEFKNHLPYYRLMWKVDSKSAERLMEMVWAGHIIRWELLDYNRHADAEKKIQPQWDSEFNEDIEVPFATNGNNLSFCNVTPSLMYSGVMLSVLDRNEDVLLWTRRLIYRWQQGRDTNTGLCGGQLSYRKNDRAQIALGHVHPTINEAKIVGCYHQSSRYHLLPLAQMQAGETLIAAG